MFSRWKPSKKGSSRRLSAWKVKAGFANPSLGGSHNFCTWNKQRTITSFIIHENVWNTHETLMWNLSRHDPVRFSERENLEAIWKIVSCRSEHVPVSIAETPLKYYNYVCNNRLYRMAIEDWWRQWVNFNCCEKRMV